MSTCHASSIVFDGHVLAWFGQENATWSVLAGRLRAIRELVAESGDVRWYVVFDIDGQDLCLRAPANANGMDRVLTALGERFKTKLELQLERATAGSNRIVWSRPP